MSCDLKIESFAEINRQYSPYIGTDRDRESAVIGDIVHETKKPMKARKTKNKREKIKREDKQTKQTLYTRRIPTQEKKFR